MKNSLSAWKAYTQLCMSLTLMSTLNISFALPFSIVPNTSLPTNVFNGGSVIAYYKVTNNTSTRRKNNHVRYLPPHVAQIITNKVGTCGSLFNLEAYGSLNDHCILELKITGTVDKNDMNPQHHLFVCFPGDITCAGTNYPLDVNLISSPPLAASGFYSANAQRYMVYPLIAISSDRGDSWSYPVEKGSMLPTDFPTQVTETTPSFQAIKCDGNGNSATCIAVGHYADTTQIQYPLIGYSKDGGKTWTYPVEKGATLPTNFVDKGNLSSLSCTGSGKTALCIAVGTYQDSTYNIPVALIALSRNGGSSWSYPIDSRQQPPQLTDYVTFNAASCKGNVNSATCIAAGTYFSDATPYPLIASSNNGGRTWSYSVSKESLLPPDFQGNGGFGAANCFGNDDDIRCIATGSYEDQDSTQYPLVALSTNGGKTWSYPVSKTSIATTKPTNYSGGGVFNGASCSGKGTKAICIASGSYEEGDLLQNPMVSLSSNGGMTWSYPIDSKTLPIDFLKGASLFGANCIGTGSTTQCMATGNYIAKNLITYPLLIASSNAGVTWNYSIEKTKKLPAAYQNEGILTAVNCSEGTGICLASGLYVTNGIQFPLLALSSKGDPTQWTFPIEKGRTLPKGFISQGFLAGIN